MDDLVSLISRHGYLLLAAIVFAEAIGLPLPAALALLAAGAACAWKILNPGIALAVSVIFILLGDWLLFLLGRYSGWGLLGFLCRVSLNPETCILRSAESFYKRGKLTLVIAKFIPGINTMAPPLAGSMNMRAEQFLRFDLAGCLVYSLAFGGIGFLFSDFVRVITKGVQAAGAALEIVLIVAVVAYLIYRAWTYYSHRVYRVVPRVQAEEVARKLSNGGEGVILVADVRSHGYYNADTQRIKGSIRIEPNNLEEEIKNLPKDREIYLYCT
jgi:membrane protein DedA with SNARE-associated domain